MNRRTRALAVIVIGVLCLISGGASATCPNGCAPIRKPGWPGMQYSVAFGSNFSAGAQNAIFDGLNYWNNYFGSSSVAAPFQFSAANAPAGITIVVDPSLHGSGIGARYDHAAGNGTGTINLNPDYLGDPNILRTIMEHEFGHGLGFNDVETSSCNGLTSMFSATQGGTVSPVGTTMTECDGASAISYWPPPPPQSPTGGSGPISCDPGHPCDGSLNGAGAEEPLILDLNGDGIHTTSLETDPILFDMNADGRPDLTAWTDPDTEEGLLFYDRNHNHVIDGTEELFGNRTPLPDGTIAPNEVEALAAYDLRRNLGNGDGVIGPGDAVWGILRVWVDRNHDGVATSSETYSLPELGIVAINLTFERFGADRSYGKDESGNFHVYQGSFQRVLRGRAGVVQRQIHDVFFRVRYQ